MPAASARPRLTVAFCISGLLLWSGRWLWPHAGRSTTRQLDHIVGLVGIARLLKVGRDDLGAAGEGGMGTRHIVGLGFKGFDIRAGAHQITLFHVLTDLLA